MSRQLFSYENRLVAILGLTFGFVFLDRNATSFLAPFLVDDLKLSNAQVGLLASVLSLTWAASGYMIGLLSDRSGQRKIYLVWAVVIFSLASFMSGLAQSFVLLLIARLLMGIAEGPVLPIAQAFMALESSPTRRGLNMGLMQNVMSALLGSALAPLLLVWLATRFGWRAAFFIAGVPGLIMAFLLAKYVREPKPQAIASASAQSTAPRMSTSQLLAHRNILLCVLIACLMVAWMVLGWTFLPLFYVKVRGFKPEEMGVLMSVLGFCAASCGFIVPALSDKFGRKPIMIFFSLLGMLTPLAAMYFQGSFVALCALVFIGWSAAGTFPIYMATIPAETVPVQNLSTALGLIMGVGEIAGGVIAPYVTGIAADSFGLATPVTVQVVCAGAAGLLAFFLKETAPLKVGQRSDRSAVSVGLRESA